MTHPSRSPLRSEPAPLAADPIDFALAAARHARALAGDEESAGDEARRDAFAALLYGLSIGFASAAAPGGGGTDGSAGEALAELTDTLATRLVREVLRVPFRDACRSVEALSDALVSDRPDAAVLGLVREGVAAAADWIGGDRAAFETRILRATAGDGYVSDVPLRPRR
jgi:hypothetical protein